MVTREDQRRLRDGAEEMKLTEPETEPELALYVDQLGDAIAALQSLDDLGSAEANRIAWHDMTQLQIKHRAALQRLQTIRAIRAAANPLQKAVEENKDKELYLLRNVQSEARLFLESVLAYCTRTGRVNAYSDRLGDALKKAALFQQFLVTDVTLHGKSIFVGPDTCEEKTMNEDVKKESKRVVSTRRFYLQRNEDKTGTSGTGKVAEGVMFSSGRVAMTWLSHFGTVTFYDNMQVVEHLHGHEGATTVVWVDP